MSSFPTHKQVEEAFNDLVQTRDFFEAVTGTEVPQTLKQAIDEKWELAAAAAIVEFKLEYHKAQQRADRQRMISLPVALALLADWEEQLVRDQVLNSRQVAWKILGTVPRVILTIWGNRKAIWETVQLIYQLATTPSLAATRRALGIIWQAAGATISIIVVALKPEDYQVVIVSVLKDRDRITAALRKAAWKQGKGRWRRRKPSLRT